MGLDQYLSVKKFLSEYTDREKFNEVKNIFNINEADSGEVSLTLGYWRKANAIHGWFVKNVVEDPVEWSGEAVWIDREKLMELRAACQALVDCKEAKDEREFLDVVGKLLPPEEGFFFGSTEIDEYYITCLEDTIKIIDKVMKLPTTWDIYYSASW